MFYHLESTLLPSDQGQSQHWISHDPKWLSRTMCSSFHRLELLEHSRKILLKKQPDWNSNLSGFKTPWKTEILQSYIQCAQNFYFIIIYYLNPSMPSVNRNYWAIKAWMFVVSNPVILLYLEVSWQNLVGHT